MDSHLVILFLIVGLGIGTLAKYRKTGNHWGNEEDSLLDFTAYTNTIISEWEALISQQDAVDIARKYSTDVVWLHPVFGQITTREGVTAAYEALFSIGVTNVKTTLLRTAYIGDGYAYTLMMKDFRNKDDQTVLISEDLIVALQLKEGGFQVIFKSTSYADGKDVPKRDVVEML